MEKLVYLLNREKAVPGADLRMALVEKAAPALRQAGAHRITVAVDDEDVAQGDGIAIRKSVPPIRALVSFWLENVDDRGPCEDVLSREAESLSGYLVAESRVLLHDPPVGERARGTCIVTCINKQAGLSEEEFFDRWTRDHKAVAIETQSTFGYVRNTVVRKLTASAPDWDGIVEESFPIEALTDPHVFYAASSQEDYKQRLTRMIESCNRFIDLGPLESTPMSEYFLD
jgi:hypothetical protein